MNKKAKVFNGLAIRLSIASFSIVVSQNVLAEPNEADLVRCFKPYFGASIQNEHIRFQERYGAPYYNRTLSTGSMILGLRFYDFFGVEFDYTLSQRKNKIRTLVGGHYAPEAAYPIPPGYYEVYKTRLAVDSVNLGITAYLPLNSINFDKTSLFTYLGGSLLKVKANHTVLQHNYVGLTQQEINGLSYRFKNSYRKLVPYLKMGIENKITDTLSMRIFASWKRVANFDTKSSGLLISKGHLKYSSSVGYGVSLFYYF